jgi:hypothetical protein
MPGETLSSGLSGLLGEVPLYTSAGTGATLKSKPSTKTQETDPTKTTIAQLYGSGGHLSSVQKFVAGMECEIEGLTGSKIQSFGHFQCKEDHSLRNSGMEYVSAPLERDALLNQFVELHKWLKLDQKKEPFSERTSVHVHVNVSSMTMQHAKNMMLLYALFEEFFFSMVKPERRANIHCVPLTETHLPAIYNKNIPYLRDRWSKYAALNLIRMSDLGTMEFRHHHGTGDTEEMTAWLKVLDNLWTLSRQVVIDEESLSNQSRIYSWFDAIFNPSPKTIMLGGQLHNIIQNSLIDVKFSVLKD